MFVETPMTNIHSISPGNAISTSMNILNLSHKIVNALIFEFDALWATNDNVAYRKGSLFALPLWSFP